MPSADTMLVSLPLRQFIQRLATMMPRRHRPRRRYFTADPQAAEVQHLEPRILLVTFQGVDSLSGVIGQSYINAVTPDGSTVVGFSNTSHGSQAFRWSTQTGIAYLGYFGSGDFSTATCVSADGSVVFGYANIVAGSASYHGFQWTAATGMVESAILPTAVSSDGSLIAGQLPISPGLFGGRAAEATSDGSVEELGIPPGFGDMPGNPYSDRPVAMSADGSIIVGVGGPQISPSSNTLAIRWTSTGDAVQLPLLHGDATGYSLANGISSDGSIIVGTCDSTLRDANGNAISEACLWSGDGVVSLGGLSGLFAGSQGLSISDNGSIVVGIASSGSTDVAAIWDSVHGMRSLQEVLASDYGLDPSQLAGWHLEAATTITPDGHTIIGNGISPSGMRESWVARLDATDIVANRLSWNTDSGGVVISYTITDGNLPQSTSAVLYWATGPTIDDIQGSRIPAGVLASTKGDHQLYVPAPNLGTPPAGTRALLLVLDPPDVQNPAGQIVEINEENNVVALGASPTDILKDSVRAFASGGTIRIAFKPATGALSDDAAFEQATGALSLAQAAAICGVDHFTWSQTYTLPPDWQAYRVDLSPEYYTIMFDTAVHTYVATPNVSLKLDGAVVVFKDSNHNGIEDEAEPSTEIVVSPMALQTIEDPLVQLNDPATLSFQLSINQSTKKLFRTMLTTDDPQNASWIPPDNLPYYWNEGLELAAHGNSNELDFDDTPSLAGKMGGTVSFETRLTEVDVHGGHSEPDGIKTRVKWKSDATNAAVDINYVKVSSPAIVPLIAGGVFDVRFDLLPVLDPIHDQVATEGSLIAVTATVATSDPSSPFLYTLDAAPEGASIDPVTGVFTWTAGDGPSAADVTVRVANEAFPDLFDTKTFHILVSNASPMLSLSGAAHVDEGSLYTLALGTVVDPGQDAVSEYVVHWGDGRSDVIHAADLSLDRHLQHIYADGYASRTISVDLVDDDGLYDSVAVADVIVDNVAPQLSISGAGSFVPGVPFALTLGPVVDPGPDTVSKYIVHWGDGLTDDIAAADLPGDRKLEHTYAAGASAETISVDLVDEDSVTHGGTPDINFGNSGVTDVSFGFYAEGYGVAAAPAGKSVVFGLAGELSFLRFNADGSLDSAFGSDGRVPFDFAINPANGGIAVDAAGRILVPGQIFNPGTGRETFAIARYSANGSLDLSFGNSGIAEIDFNSSSGMAQAVTVDTAGRILVTGSIVNPVTSMYDLTVARFTPNGTIDSTFSGAGSISINLGGTSTGRGIAVAPDGSSVVFSVAMSGTLLRFNADGSFDQNFGNNGRAAFDKALSPGLGGIAIDVGGGILVPGQLFHDDTSAFDFAVARYTPDGKRDLSFATSGIATIELGSNYGSANAAAIDAQGRILVTGVIFNSANSTYNIVLARLLSERNDPYRGVSTLTINAGTTVTLTDTSPLTTYVTFVGSTTADVVLATFTSSNPSASVGDFTPIASWGGSVTGTPGVVVQLVSLTATESDWQVVGAAKYSVAGHYIASVTVADISGSHFQSSRTDFQVFDTTPPASVDFNGEYSVLTTGSNMPTLASIAQTGNALTLTGSSMHSATVTSPTQILVGGIDVAQYGDNAITFTTGALAGQVWTKINLPHDFTNPAGAPVHVTQNGSTVIFTDKFGNTATGTWLTPNLLSAFGETLTFGNGYIVWSSGTIWSESVHLNGFQTDPGPASIVAAPSQMFVTNYLNGRGGEAYVIQNGTITVVFVDSLGTIALGTFFNATQADSDRWSGDVATFAGNEVQWSDGTVWTRTSAPGASAPVVTDYTNAPGVTTHTVQNGTSQVLFADSVGDLALGRFINATQAVADRWTSDLATFGATTVTWQDGMVWTKAVNPPITITATDSNGVISHLKILNLNSVVGLDGPLSGIIGTGKNGNLYWSNGDIWIDFDFDALDAFFMLGT